jgi:hypothetical protein
MDLALWMAKRMMVEVYKGRQNVEKVSHQLGGSLGNGEALQSMLMRGVGIAMQRMHQSYKCMKAHY